jgi:hypothetical protein
MDRGVLRVRAPDGSVWWVKRAWVPRVHSWRDGLGEWLDTAERHWWQAPARLYARGYTRVEPDTDPEPGGRPAVSSAPDGPPAAPPYRLDASAGVWPSWSGDGHGSSHVRNLPDIGGGGSLPGDMTAHGTGHLVSIGGGGGLPGDGSGRLVDVGGGGALPGDGGAGAAGGGHGGAGGGGGGHGGHGGGGGGGHGGHGGGVTGLEVVVALLAAAIVVILVLVVVVPAVLALFDLVVLVVAAVLAGAVRVVLRRPWDVVATRDLPDGSQRVRRWEIVGFRRAGRVRDDVARALETGTDAELAVARVVVREPVAGEPPGSARAARELHRHR